MKALSYRIGEIEVLVSQHCLRRDGASIYLRAKTFQVLLYLLEHRDRLVTKQELFQALWGDVAVSDSSLVQCIIDLRKALGDHARNPLYIRTVSKVGYQFIANAEEVPNATVENSAPAEEQQPGNTRAQQQHNQPRRVDIWRLNTARRIAAHAFLSVTLLTVAWAVLREPAPSPSLTLRRDGGKMGIAVMYFDNESGEADSDWLRAGMANMLITNLSRSPKLAVLSGDELYSLMRRVSHAAAAPMRLEDALYVAQKSRADVVVLGEFAKLGHAIRINVHLHEAHTGRLLVSEAVTAQTADQIISEVELLSFKITRLLGVTPPARDQKAAASWAMTNNLQAYQYYSEGIEKAQAYHSREAIALFQKAVALDPQFAMALARIGFTYSVTWLLADEGKAYLQQAFRFSDRLTDRDRLYIIAWYALANLDFSAAIQKFRDLIAAYPGEMEAYASLGRLLRGEERYDEAIAALKQGLSIDGEAGDLYNVLGGIYSQQGRHDEAIAAQQRFMALSPNEPNAADSLALALLRAGRYADAEQACKRALEMNPDFDLAVRHLGTIYYRQGRYREAVREFERYARVASSGPQRADAYTSIAWCWKRRGNLARAIESLSLAASDKMHRISNSMELALWRGDWREAEQLAPRLSGELWSQRGSRPHERRLHSYLLGQLLLGRKRSDEAITEFQQAVKHWPGWADLNMFDECVADALLEVGRVDEAILEYERVLNLYPGNPLARYHLGVAYGRRGERNKAVAQFKRFLQDWAQADRDLEQLQVAKRFIRGDALTKALDFCTPSRFTDS